MRTTEPEMMAQERSNERAAILSVARAIAQRDGIENLTLGKVALEAELSRPIVYGQFLRKEDLLLTIVADDLSSLARRMSGIEWPVQNSDPEEAREGAVILALPRCELPPDSLDAMVKLAGEVSVALRASTEAEEPDSDSTSERRLTRRVDIARVLEARRIARQEESPVTSDIKSAPRTPDAWLERRLRVFERAMTVMQARQEQVEKDSRTVVANAEVSINAMQEKLRELTESVASSQSRQMTAANEVRTALNEATLRLQTVESVARAALLENEAQACDEVPAEPAPSTKEPANEAVSEPRAEAHETETNSQKSFLSVARAAAIAAASTRAAGEEETQEKPAQHNRARYMVTAIIVTAVFVAAAGVAFSQGLRDGRRDALRLVSPMIRPPAMVVAAPETRLDRLASRAAAGDDKAELAVAMMYLNGNETARDPAAGLRWMSRAAQHGNAVAQYMLGSLYQKGTGVVASPAEAKRWYEASALQGNRQAMHDLAVAYAQGLGGTRNPSEAARWFSRAASFGYVDSQFNLAVLYERGDGVPQSLLDAYKWYAIAGAQGDAESRSRLDALRSQLSLDDLAAAQHAADAFRPLSYDVAASLPSKG